jgi:hypothetical protein
MTYVKTSLRAEERSLREEMRALGMSHRQIAVEFARRYGYRPRAAWRHAYGWSLKDAADNINSRAADTGLDQSGTAAMTGPHLCEYENWPGPGEKPTGRRPTPLVLALLSATYNTSTLHDLLDLADYQQMPAADRIILDTSSAERPASTTDPRGTRPALPRANLRKDQPLAPPVVSNTFWPDADAAGIPPVLAPLAAAMLTMPAPDGQFPARELADESVRIWKLRQASRYLELAAELPQALAKARCCEALVDLAGQPTGLAALTHLYNAASSVAKSLGAFELAGIAADRAVQTASRTADPLLAGAAAYRLANVLLSAGQLGSARFLAISAADRLRPVMTATASHTSMWGALLATAAQAAAKEQAAAEAWELLGSAKVAADLLPSEQADLFSIFGPVSWLIHAVSIAADLGDGSEAIRRASLVPAGRLQPFLAERKTFLLLGKARGHALRHDVGSAAAALLEAEHAAPEEIRHNSDARRLILHLLSASPAKNRSLLELESRMTP